MQASVLLLLSFLALSFSQNSYQQHDEPYFLSTGEVYRDKVTLETAKQAAKLAKKVKQESKIEEPKETENSFPTKLNFYQLKNFTFGEPLHDYEIFGYIDSQFLNPPFENLENRLFLPRDDGVYGIKIEELEAQLTVSTGPKVDGY